MFPVPGLTRKQRTLRFPIWTSVVLMTINVGLLVLWIVLLVLDELPGAITIGVIAFALGLFGIAFYLALTIKAIRLNRRQANFVDSVTHELKTPIASLRLCVRGGLNQRPPGRSVDRTNFTTQQPNDAR